MAEAKPAHSALHSTTTQHLKTKVTVKGGYDIASCNILMIIKIIFHRKNSVILHSRGKSIWEPALVVQLNQ